MRGFVSAALISVLTAAAVLGVACKDDGATTAANAGASPGPESGRVIITLGMAQTSFFYQQKPNPDVRVELGKEGTEIVVRILELEGKYADHNIRFAGADDQYGTPDDRVTGHEPGEQYGELKFMVNQPGVLKFRCDPHAEVMTGMLTIVRAGS